MDDEYEDSRIAEEEAYERGDYWEDTFWEPQDVTDIYPER
jgi:hypothetical protein